VTKNIAEIKILREYLIPAGDLADTWSLKGNHKNLYHLNGVFELSSFAASL